MTVQRPLHLVAKRSLRRHPLLWTIALLFLTVVVYLGFIVSDPMEHEIAEKENFFIPSQDPILRAELKPNYTGIFTGTVVPLPPSEVRISEQGLRDRYYSLQKPPGITRVAVVGDSGTFGWGVEWKDTFVKLAEQKINAERKDKVEVMNFAVPGYNIPQFCEVIRTRVMDFKPDFVVVVLSFNDFDPSGNQLLDDPDSLILRLWNRYPRARRFLVAGRGIPWLIESRIFSRFKSLPDRVSNILKQIIETVHAHQSQAGFFFFESVPYKKSLVDFLRPADVCLYHKSVDLGPDGVYRSDWHPNAKGHNRIAVPFAAFLKECLDGREEDR